MAAVVLVPRVMEKTPNPFSPIADPERWMKDLDEIDGLVDLLLFDEAWELLQRLPARLQTCNRVARARVPCLLSFGDVELALRFANMLRYGDDTDRMGAVSALVAVAARDYSEKRPDDGWRLLQLAIWTRPDLEPIILADSRLPKNLLHGDEKATLSSQV